MIFILFSYFIFLCCGQVVCVLTPCSGRVVVVEITRDQSFGKGVRETTGFVCLFVVSNVKSLHWTGRFEIEFSVDRVVTKSQDAIFWIAKKTDEKYLPSASKNHRAVLH